MNAKTANRVVNYLLAAAGILLALVIAVQTLYPLRWYKLPVMLKTTRSVYSSFRSSYDNGNLLAQDTITVFLDTNCSANREYIQENLAYLAKQTDFRIRVVLYPLSAASDRDITVISLSQCFQTPEQSLEYLMRLGEVQGDITQEIAEQIAYEIQPELDTACIEKRTEEARLLFGNGTSYIDIQSLPITFVRDRYIVGAVDPMHLHGLVNSLRVDRFLKSISLGK